MNIARGHESPAKHRAFFTVSDSVAWFVPLRVLWGGFGVYSESPQNRVAVAERFMANCITKSQEQNEAHR